MVQSLLKIFVRTPFYHMLVVLALFSNTAKAQWPEQKHTLNFQHIKILQLLDSLSTWYSIDFSYNADIPAFNNDIDIKTTATLDEILKTAFAKNDIEFSIIGKQVIIYTVVSAPFQQSVQQTGTIKNITVNGHITDIETSMALPYVSVSVMGTGIGTVSNAEGAFSLRISADLQHDSIGISCLGYQSVKIPCNYMNNSELTIALTPRLVLMKPVVVKHISASALVHDVTTHIHRNYPCKNAMYTAFYRETTHNDNDFINISEAVLDLAKAPYNSLFLNDQAHIFKGRHNENRQALKNLSYKLEGGIYNCLRLDIIKESAPFLQPENETTYTYTLVRTEYINNRLLYIIDFEPHNNNTEITYQGTLYIDEQTQALVLADFELSAQGIKLARNMLIRKQPRKAQIKPISAHYIVHYRYWNGHWYLEYTKAEIKIKARSERLFFNSTFTSVAEMAVTNIDTTNTNRFKYNEITKERDIFSDKKSDFDSTFWDSYNIIKPEESLLEAVKKISASKNIPSATNVP